MKPSGEKHIITLILHSAKGFYDIGFNCAYHLSKDNDITGFQRIPAGAINMAFSAELFLKGIHLISSGSASKGHKLHVLYRQLNGKIKQYLNERYRHQKLHNKEMDELPSLRMVVTNREKSNKGNIPEYKNISEFLKHHSLTFERWRYFHEIKEKEYSYELDLKSMDCFIKALIEWINKNYKSMDFSLEKPN